MPLDLPLLRAAVWTVRAARRARNQLRAGMLEVELPAVPNVPAAAERAVGAVLARRRDTCLVRATVQQAWYATHGSRRDLVIGVTRPGAGFQAHAWLDGDPPCHAEGFHELLRRPAR